jgi:hypothetical protein
LRAERRELKRAAARTFDKGETTIKTRPAKEF